MKSPELLDDGFTFDQFATIASPVFDTLYRLAVSDDVSKIFDSLPYCTY